MLIGISILVAIFFLYAFIRAVKKGQYDDDYTPSVRMLFEDEIIKEKKTKNFPVLEVNNLNQNKN
jgi:cbb3-type cytochrome oxidase maturation protein